MNASYFIEFARGDQLLSKIPELTGVGFAGNGFKVAPKEAVALTKVAIAGPTGLPAGDAQRAKWISHLVTALKTRRGEFTAYKKAVIPGVTGFERLTQFANEL